MIVFIPLSSGQSIRSGVLESLSSQSIGCSIVPCCSSGVFNSNGINTIEKLEAECNSRNLAVTFFNKYYADEKYVAMNDRDIRHVSPINFERCIEYLEKNDNCDAVALPWKDEIIKDHIKCSSFVVRGSVFKTMRFHLEEKMHICLGMMRDLKNYQFLPSDRRLIIEII